MAIYKKPHKRSGVEHYYIRFTLADGRRKKEKAGTTLQQAQRLQKKRLGEVVAGTYQDPRQIKKAKGPTAREFYDERFMPEYGSLRRSDHYRDKLKQFLSRFGSDLMSSIKRADLDSLIASRLRKVSGSTVRKEVAAIKTLFKMAVRWEVLESSSAVDLVSPPERRQKTRYLSAEELAGLLEVAPAWLQPMIRMAVSTGMRLKEVVGLRWADWNRQADVLELSDDNKTARTRTIPLNSTSREVLEGQVRHFRSPYVFIDPAGESYTSDKARNVITRATKAAMRAAGIEDATFINLRHTAASLMVQNGVPLYEVQQILGHSTPLMTQRYASLMPGHLRGAVDTLDAALRARAPQSAPGSKTAAAGTASLSPK